jgi:hypothetical protein
MEVWMNSAEAKKILILFRPGLADGQDPEIAEALKVVDTDPELAAWFRQHCEFQQAMKKGLRQVAPPPGLKKRLLAAQKIVPLPFWRRPAVRWAAAAAAVAIFAVAITSVRRPLPGDLFANYQFRMVASTVRQYHMDVRTSDMGVLRAHLAAGGSPADYQVPAGLKSRQLSGGGVLKWRGHPVSMVCFDRGDKQMLFLFVADRASFKDPPSSTPQMSQLDQSVSVSWAQGDRVYTLAGPGEAGFIEKYL